MTLPLYLVEPQASPAWAPFNGSRPIAEVRAGIWRVRERWEAAIGARTAAVLSDQFEVFHDTDEPPMARRDLAGPGIVAASWFAPSGAPPPMAPGVRRLTNGEETVAWVLGSGEPWSERDRAGPAVPIDGIILRGSFDLITAIEQLLPADCAGFLQRERDLVPSASVILGDPGAVVCRGALVEPGVVFDVREGPVILESGTEVRNGSRLEGPLYIGSRSSVLGGHLRGSVLGPRTRVKGEVASSVFLGYANKSHDGFVGHSVIGHWVNLGAGTTTSNLKNTYGPVTLIVAGEQIETGRQFLGSLIGDHVKTAIGTMLGTGTVIGTGANLFGPTLVPKYVPPFAWGNAGTERMTEDGFLRIAERVMPRREVPFTAERRASLAAMYRRLPW